MHVCTIVGGGVLVQILTSTSLGLARATPGRREIFISGGCERSRQIPADLAGLPLIPADLTDTLCMLGTVSGIGAECTFVHGHPCRVPCRF
jgi:hypothetical protein